MKLVIIPSDGAVYKDNVAFINLDLTSCNIPSNVHALQWNNTSGWIEYNDGSVNQEISILPEWALSCESVWTSEDILSKEVKPITVEMIKNQAAKLLKDSDWAVLEDVSLSNSEEFISYRAILREIFLNPSLDAVFPVEPTPVWA